jgi:hypothetical protein
MRGVEWKTILAAAIAGSTLFIAAGAQAHDDDDWRWRHRHSKHWHHGPERVVVERQPIYVERARPVYVQPAPVMMAPMNYGPPPEPSLNFNFQIPLR